MDDAFHYLRERGLKANHISISSVSQMAASIIMPPENFVSSSKCPVDGSDVAESCSSRNSVDTPETSDNSTSRVDSDSKAAGLAMPCWPSQVDAYPKLLIWTAGDEKALDRVVLGYNEFCRSLSRVHGRNLDLLAYTLAQRRTLMPWRSYAVVERFHGTDSLLSTSKAVRASSSPSDIAAVFTGQGAQYVKMGLDLMHYENFQVTLQQIDETYKSLGSPWSLFGMLKPYSNKPASLCPSKYWVDEILDQYNINRPGYSQPLCTALQIALVELLRSFGVAPHVVVGHSSGEIAAAYVTHLCSPEKMLKLTSLGTRLVHSPYGQLARSPFTEVRLQKS